MNAAEVLRTAEEAGVRFEFDAGDLVVEADREPEPWIFEAICREKAGIRALLQSSNDDWSSEDWQTYFHERAAHLEYEGGQSRKKAEANAYECCISEWLNGHQQPSDPGRCVWCRKPEREGSAVVPFGADGHGHTWLHPECWDEWHQHRRKKARQELARIEICSPGRAKPSSSTK